MFPPVENSPLSVRTALGDNALWLSSFRGTTGLSELFRFELELLAELPGFGAFDQVLGQPARIRVRQADGQHAHFHGLVSRLRRAGQDRDHVRYQATVVPRLWLLTKKVQSRAFQQQSVPDILQAVFDRLRPDVEFRWHKQADYQPRDYCVQYRESDFAFASRLMEEEGIYYYFEHTDETHKLIVTDSQVLLPAPKQLSSLPFDDTTGGNRASVRVVEWSKTQEVSSSDFTFWDQCFELGDQAGHGFQTLEAKKQIVDKVKVGSVEHNFKLNLGQGLEVYDCPGGYAKEFDGINPDGAARPNDLRHIFERGQRLALRRAEAEIAASLQIDGASNCAQAAPGHKFQLTGPRDDAGQYYFTRVEHTATLSQPRSGEPLSFDYQNRFACLPVDLPYRPAVVTPQPRIEGVQTATVVGAGSGENGTAPHVDKYGRVKVQFHWDRARKFDGHSSCWLRVSQLWAGQRWGAFFWPRPGHEVIVAFENGDPDCPLVTGSVYNAANMPPFELPGGSLSCGFKSCTPKGDPLKNYNGMIFHDQPDHEYVEIHSEGHEVVSAEGRRFSDCPGPMIETFGSPSFPLPGSGSGSGDDRDVSGPSGKGLKDWLKNASKYVKWSSWLKKGLLPGEADFPSKTSITCGDTANHTFMAKELNFRIWGTENNYHFCDPNEFFEKHMGKFLQSKLGKTASLAIMKTYTIGMKLGLPEPSGNFDLTVGKAMDLTYGSDEVEVKRGCNKFELEEEDFDLLTAPASARAVWAFVTMNYFVSTAATYLGRRFNGMTSEGEVKEPSFAFTLYNTVSTKLGGFSYEFEGFLAKKHSAAEKAKQTKQNLARGKAWLALGQVLPGFLDQVQANINQGRAEALQMAEIVQSMTGEANAAVPQHNKVLNSAYSLQARSVNFSAGQPEGEDPLPGVGHMTLHARGGADAGRLSLQGGNDQWGVVTLETGGNTVTLVHDDDNDLLIESNSPGKITLLQRGTTIDSTIKLKGDGDEQAIEIGCQNLLETTRSKLTINPRGLNLSFGPMAARAVISINQSGITLAKGETTSVTIADDHIELSAPNVSINATAQLNLSALAVEMDAETRGVLHAAIMNNGN